ncbi:MAG: transcriptional repressor LexA [Gammaproteobacteria bacterium]|nr:transcriptional repressor LexA [Gammaproteobacteria bacterium]
MPEPLTRKQQAIHEFLCRHRCQFAHPPTLDELCTALHLSSRGSLHKHIQALVVAGLVEPMDRKQRGVRVNEGACEGLLDEDEVPFLGYIAAGRPIEAIPNPEPMEVPQFLRGRGETYVLQVRGDSMVDEGILDGDWVVIERRDQARNGDIVVALIDDGEATLKRLEHRGDRVVLHPANSAMSSMEYPAASVRVQGVLVGQMRAY